MIFFRKEGLATNNKYSKELCHSQFQGSELYHHGILGMHWGIRRFQPYPKGYNGDGKFLGSNGLTSGQQRRVVSTLRDGLSWRKISDGRKVAGYFTKQGRKKLEKLKPLIELMQSDERSKELIRSKKEARREYSEAENKHIEGLITDEQMQSAANNYEKAEKALMNHYKNLAEQYLGKHANDKTGPFHTQHGDTSAANTLAGLASADFFFRGPKTYDKQQYNEAAYSNTGREIDKRLSRAGHYSVMSSPGVKDLRDEWTKETIKKLPREWFDPNYDPSVLPREEQLSWSESISKALSDAAKNWNDNYASRAAECVLRDTKLKDTESNLKVADALSTMDPSDNTIHEHLNYKLADELLGYKKQSK